ncbi:MAG: alkaline phosphatase family protein [Thermoanaerobaculia bacterium]
MAAPPRPSRKRLWLPFGLLLTALAGLAAVLLEPAAVVPSVAEPPQVPELTSATVAGRPLILLEVEGFERAQLLGAGNGLPHLAYLVANGRSGPLSAAAVAEPPVLWSSLATGSEPLVHGVLDFTRFRPEGGARQAITRYDRRVPALWTFASAAGKRVGVFGGWASWPAEPLHGLSVAELRHEPMPLEPLSGAVYPPAEAGLWARALESAERGLKPEALRPYLALEPGPISVVAPAPGSPELALRTAFSELRALDTLAKDWLGRAPPPDLLVLSLRGFDAACRLALANARSGEDTVASPAAAASLKELDQLAEEYRRRAEQAGGALLLVATPGYRLHLPSVAALGQAEGFYVLWGAGVSPDQGAAEPAEPSRLFATAAAYLGLPVLSGAEVPVLGGVELPPGDRQVEGRGLGLEGPERELAEPAAARQAGLELLRGYGYLEETDLEDAPASVKTGLDSRTPAALANEGLLLAAAGELDAAQSLLERALHTWPENPRLRWALSQALYLAGGDRERSDSLLLGAAAELADGPRLVAERSQAWWLKGETERALRLLNAALVRQPAAGLLRWARGRLRYQQPDCAAALTDLVQAAALLPGDPQIQASLGLARLCVGERAAGREALQRSLALEPAQPELRDLLELGVAGP